MHKEMMGTAQQCYSQNSKAFGCFLDILGRLLCLVHFKLHRRDRQIDNGQVIITLNKIIGR